MTRIEAVTTKQDIDYTVNLAKTIWQQHYLNIIGQEQIDYMLDKFQSPAAISQQIDSGYLYFLAQHDNSHAGYLALVPDLTQSRLMISKIYVDATIRGVGIGSKMFEFTKDKAKELGLNNIWLTVNIHNTDSINWYLKHGFYKKDEVKADIGNGYFMDDYILECVVDN